ncbi:restriction endonuclease subunit S [Dehalococcoides mccartyi]|uniref:restriction endonuclease subunit S n=1 Tax=Dehalococcoides mccartyi TaxID=61435 RepID=UPI002FC8AD7D
MVVEWQEMAIGDVAEVVGGGTPSTKDESNFNGEIPWITPKDLSGYMYRYISRGDRNISQKGLQNSSAKILPKGSVLLTTRAPVGYVAISSNPVTTNQGFRSLILRDGFSPEFCYYLLKSNTDYLKAHASGTTFGELSGSTLKGLKFLFPPLPEQRTIAHILGTLDDKIELNRQMNHTLETMAQALFKSWFVDFDSVRDQDMQDSQMGEIPIGWAYKNVASTIEINPSRKLSRGVEAIYVDMAALPTSAARVSGITTRPYSGSGSRFTNGDVLLARITPCLENGKTALVDFLPDGDIGWGSTEFIVLGPKPPIGSYFIYCLARNPEFRLHAIQAMTGTSGRQRVDPACFNHYWLAVPEVDTAQKFEQHVKPWFQKMKANDDESCVLASIRDALLPKLLSGEIRVKEAAKIMENAV